MKKANLFFGLAVGAIALFSACDDKIDLKLNTSEPYLVVDGTVDNHPETVDTVRLSASVGYLQNGKLPPVRGAAVRIKGTDGQEVILEEAVPGKYVAREFTGVVGQTYTLTIATSDSERYTASGIIKRPIPIDSVKAIFKEKRTFQDAGYYVQVWYQEPVGRGDCERLVAVYNDTVQNTVNDIIAFNDDLSDGQYATAIELNRKPKNVGDTIVFRVQSITQDALYFYQELSTQTQNGGLFSQPPANVRTNVVNDNPNSKKHASGYFFCISYTEKGVRIRQ